MTQHYGVAPEQTIPPQLLLPHALPDAETIEELLRGRRGGAFKVYVPQRGDKRGLVELASKSAAENLEQERLKWLNDEQKKKYTPYKQGETFPKDAPGQCPPLE